MDRDILGLAHIISDNMVDGEQLRPDVYAKSYIAIAGLMQSNPQMEFAGVISDDAWAYSSELKRLYPDQYIDELHELAGKIITITTTEQLGMSAQVNFSTYSAEHRKHQQYEDWQD